MPVYLTPCVWWCDSLLLIIAMSLLVCLVGNAVRLDLILCYMVLMVTLKIFRLLRMRLTILLVSWYLHMSVLLSTSATRERLSMLAPCRRLSVAWTRRRAMLALSSCPMTPNAMTLWKPHRCRDFEFPVACRSGLINFACV